MSETPITDLEARAWLTPKGTDALERLGVRWAAERFELDPLLVRILIAGRSADGRAPMMPADLHAALRQTAGYAPVRDVAEWVLRAVSQHGDLATALAGVLMSPPVRAAQMARTTPLSYELAKAALENLAEQAAHPRPLEARAVLSADVPGLRVPAIPKGTREAQGLDVTPETLEPDDVLLLTKQAHPRDNGLYKVGEVDETGTAGARRDGTSGSARATCSRSGPARRLLEHRHLQQHRHACDAHPRSDRSRSARARRHAEARDGHHRRARRAGRDAQAPGCRRT